jgi:PAS domain S-box-containing protein
MIGYSKDELIGRPLAGFISEEQLGSFLAEMDKRREGKDPVYRTEWIKKDGGIVYTNVSPRILYNENNEPNGSYAVVTDISGLKLAEDELRGLLQEKTILLKEIHHRVKNNLQLISSLFNLQLQNSEDREVKNLLSASQSRILTMCRIHEFLYQSENFREVEMKGFLEHLVYDIQSIFLENDGAAIDFSIHADVTNLTVNRAVPCGLIMNELISNAVKHAVLPEKENQQKPKISVFLFKEKDVICFGVEDDGTGVFSASRHSEKTGTGMRLITVLTDQLGGGIEFKKGNKGRGNRIEITISSA